MTTKLSKWIDHEFSGGSTNGSDFLQFAKDYKKELNKVAEALQARLIISKPGHYYLSRFIEKDGKYVYGDTSDVRFSKNRHDRILIREAKHEKDFGGGMNTFTTIDNLQANINSLLQ